MSNLGVDCKGGKNGGVEMPSILASMKELRETLTKTLSDVEGQILKYEELIAAEVERRNCIQHRCNENPFGLKKETRRLATYFWCKGLLITSIQESTPIVRARYNLAKTILDAQDALLPVLRFLYGRKDDAYCISNLSATDKTSVCNFLAQLKRMQWLDYEKKKDLISVSRKIPKDQYVFFNGGWAEDAARYVIEKTLHDLDIPFNKSFREVKVEGVSGKGNVHEFDFVVEFEDRFYIFEMKTGALGVERWIDHARMFNDAKGVNRFLMCSNDDSINARLFQPYRLFHLKTLDSEFGEYVKQEFLRKTAV